ncbi:MAG: ATP-binding protein [Pseudomonadota bacterium]
MRLQIANLTVENQTLELAAAGRQELENQIDQLREANQNLMVATINAQTLRDDAEAANLRQNDFLAMLAHELRNPLAPIGMASAMLARLPAPSVQLLNLHAIINRQVRHLAKLLDDLLDAARISSGKITLSRSTMSIQVLLERAVQTVQARIKERGQVLALDFPEQAISVDGDQVRLAQVFANLLVNASKFTQDAGRISLSVRALGGNAVISVEDNGAGISTEVLPHIFALFTQGPRTLARAEGGLGVGLNVVRNVVELHGGRVVVDSAGLGMGSTFTVTLPLATEGMAQQPPSAPHDRALHRLRILLVEDNQDANDTLAMFLRDEGHYVASAFDGKVGLEMARVEVFDLLICDIGLPGLDGYQLIKELRGTHGAHIPFAIAVSGYGQAEDQARAIGAGFGQYFVKPLDQESLLALIASKAVTRLIDASRQLR